jgi:hypothetical protein
VIGPCAQQLAVQKLNRYVVPALVLGDPRVCGPELLGSLAQPRQHGRHVRLIVEVGGETAVTFRSGVMYKTGHRESQRTDPMFAPIKEENQYGADLYGAEDDETGVKLRPILQMPPFEDLGPGQKPTHWVYEDAGSSSNFQSMTIANIVRIR